MIFKISGNKSEITIEFFGHMPQCHCHWKYDDIDPQSPTQQSLLLVNYYWTWVGSIKVSLCFTFLDQLSFGGVSIIVVSLWWSWNMDTGNRYSRFPNYCHWGRRLYAISILLQVWCAWVMMMGRWCCWFSLRSSFICWQTSVLTRACLLRFIVHQSLNGQPATTMREEGELPLYCCYL